MGSTQNFGLERFGASGQITARGNKFTGKDRDILDALLYTLFNHDHEVGAEPLAGPDPATYLDLAMSTTGGNIAAGRTLYYRFSYVDGAGNETAASTTVSIITPPPIPPPIAPVLTTANTGGTLDPGTYKYAVSYFQAGVGETPAQAIGTISVPSGTNTNVVILGLPPYRPDTEGWKIYRRGPNDPDFYLVETLVAGATPDTVFTDDGSYAADTSRRRPNTNTTNSKNRVLVTLPSAELPLASTVAAWRLYRTSQTTEFPSRSLVASITTTTTQGGSDLVTSYDDTGLPLGEGIPLDQTAVPPRVRQLDAGRVFSSSRRLPSELAPQGVHQYYAFLPGTLAGKVYSQFYIPADMPLERIEAFFLTAPSGVDGSNNLILRVKDDSSVNEVQTLWTNATTRNAFQGVYATGTSGGFTLGDGVDTTSSIDITTATAATLKTRLEADIASITTVNVSGSGTVNDPWVVEFVNPGAQPVTLMTKSHTFPTGDIFVYHAQAGNDGGGITLSDGVDTTSEIAFSASAATVKTRLEADITAITTVTVTGSGTEADPWVITLTNPAETNLPLLIVDESTYALNGEATIEETVRGRGPTIVELVVDDTGQYHFWQSSTTDDLEQEAEGVTGGVEVSDSSASNDLSAELDIQNETNTWDVGVLDPGEYVARFYVSDVDGTGSFTCKVLDDLATPDLVASLAVGGHRLAYTPAYEVEFTSTGVESFQLQVEKTDAGVGRVRVDRYEIEALLPTLYAGQTGTIEVQVVGSPGGNGADVQVNVWY